MPHSGKKFLLLWTISTGIVPLAFAGNSFQQMLGPDERYHNVVVAKVIKADVFVLENGEKIRLIGLDAPDKPAKKKTEFDQFGFPIENVNPEIPLEEQAYNFARDLLEGKSVRLEFDEEQTSSEFETYAYVFLPDGTFVNAEILKAGMANLKTHPTNKKYADVLKSAYQEARQEKRGLQAE